MPEIDKRTKIVWVAAGLANFAVDLLLPTVVYALLAPTGLPAALRLAIGGTLLGAKAIGGRIEARQFRWRLAVAAAVVPSAALVGCHLAGCGNTESMVAAAVATAAIVVGDLALTRWRNRTRGRIDGFAALVLTEVVASIVLTSISGDARFVLARSSFYIAVAGLYIAATTWTDRPFMGVALKPVAAAGDPLRAEAFDRLWVRSSPFRRVYRGLTASLGAVLLADAALRIVVIYSYPSDRIVQSSLTSQLPFIVLVGAWFAIGRGLIVPRARRLLDAEMRETSTAGAASRSSDRM
ncbi:hypothetical protein IU500_03840 [Nocardia terpenica]|uniref:VC0807 family protein n=1 Tax=Nocardia terpenica TaxID=455432 RepID=UPI001892E6CC|nr:VC0807 family protein [Nocardia terpenica]MBF6059286.1 hypothetical protein [Nocardia terpenica]MBF6103175.1 hypothetical protein [Nocardia terpenica]MBF6110636.1 hypothetical protein [Nocardia terpenica]MBF6116767.1 hypothetical protein [Nocardia terpenica]